MNEPADPLAFEDALLKLEETVRELEDGRLGLDDALARYEAGIGLLKDCYGQLRRAEQRILQLTGTDDEGRPLLTPFEHTAAVEPERPEVKRRRPRAGEKDGD